MEVAYEWTANWSGSSFPSSKWKIKNNGMDGRIVWIQMDIFYRHV